MEALISGTDRALQDITNALTYYGGAVSSGAFTRINFSLVPRRRADFDPSATQWEIEVSMKCFEQPDDEKPVFSRSWSSSGDSPFAASESLAKTIEDDMRAKVEATNNALNAIALPDPTAVWEGEELPEEGEELPPEG